MDQGVNDLTFDEPTHTYRYRGKVVPSVTQVLESEGISDFSGVPAETLMLAKARGTAVHKATEYLDQGRLDWSSVDPSLLGYLEAWEKFKIECHVQIHEVERQVYHRTGYAGTIDRTGIVNGKYGLLDIKSGEPTRAAPVQTAAYQLAHPEFDKFKLRAAIQLRPDGRYKMHVYDLDPIHDANVFMAALTIYEFKRSNA